MWEWEKGTRGTSAQMFSHNHLLLRFCTGTSGAGGKEQSAAMRVGEGYPLCEERKTGMQLAVECGRGQKDRDEDVEGD